MKKFIALTLVAVASFLTVDAQAACTSGSCGIRQRPTQVRAQAPAQSRNSNQQQPVKKAPAPIRGCANGRCRL